MENPDAEAAALLAAENTTADDDVFTGVDNSNNNAFARKKKTEDTHDHGGADRLQGNGGNTKGNYTKTDSFKDNADKKAEVKRLNADIKDANNIHENADNFKDEAADHVDKSDSVDNKKIGGDGIHADNVAMDHNTNKPLDQNSTHAPDPEDLREGSRRGGRCGGHRASGLAHKYLFLCVYFALLIACAVVVLDVFIYVALKELKDDVKNMHNRPSDGVDILMIQSQLEYIEDLLESPFARRHDSDLLTPNSTGLTGNSDLDSIIALLNATLEDDELNKQLEVVEASVEKTVMKAVEIFNEELIMSQDFRDVKSTQEAIRDKQKKISTAA